MASDLELLDIPSYLFAKILSMQCENPNTLEMMENYYKNYPFYMLYGVITGGFRGVRGGRTPPPLKFSKIRILVHNDKCAHISVNS